MTFPGHSVITVCLSFSSRLSCFTFLFNSVPALRPSTVSLRSSSAQLPSPYFSSSCTQMPPQLSPPKHSTCPSSPENPSISSVASLIIPFNSQPPVIPDYPMDPANTFLQRLSQVKAVSSSHFLTAEQEGELMISCLIWLLPGHRS